MRVGLIQLNASDDPAGNLRTTEELVLLAARDGATFIVTPEVTNIVSASRTRQQEVLCHEDADPTLERMRTLAAELGIWINIGSLALKSGDKDGRFINRAFLLGPDGRIAARYDKIHMFDVELGDGESYHESKGYRPGDRAVLAETPMAKIGLTICYDLRFPPLYTALARRGAQIITIPSAFTVQTGSAHWEVLLRARAIETGCFILAPAQWGDHSTTRGRARATWGHSLAVDPWGQVLADGEDGVRAIMVDLDLDAVAEARAKVPNLANSRAFSGP
ncbi:MAG: carbon-nitrogen hydrolase family protein [Pseudomonadota bacterium]